MQMTFSGQKRGGVRVLSTDGVFYLVLTHCMLGIFFMFLLSSADIFKK